MFRRITLPNAIGFAMVLAMLNWYAYVFFYGERVWANNGAGWDGTRYVKIAQDFQELFLNKGLSSYYLMHSLPSAFVHYLSGLFEYNLAHTENVISVFLLLHYSMLALVFVYLHKIASFLKFKPQVRFVFIASIFLTVPVAKKFHYILIGTDIAALTIGVVSFYYLLVRNYWALFVLCFLGAFVYPSMIYAGTLLMVFPQGQLDYRAPLNKRNELLFEYVVGAVVLSLAVWLAFTGYRSKYGSLQISYWFFPLSLVMLCFYLCRMIRPIAPIAVLQSVRFYAIWKHLLLGLTFYGVTSFFASYFSNDFSRGISVAEFLSAIVYGAVVNPLASLVCHFSYYGPGVIMVLLLWKPIVSKAKNLGLPVLSFVGLYLILSLGRESRQFINAWPIFATLFCWCLNEYKLSWNFVGVFSALSLLLSKIWFIINVEGIGSGVLLDFPNQRFFMMNGPWMNREMYYVHLLVGVLTAVVLIKLLRKEKIYNPKFNVPVFRKRVS